MSKEVVIWLTIAVYIVFIAAVGLISRRSSKSMTDFTVGGRNAGAWVTALSYGTAYFSAVMFIGYAGTTGWKYGLWAVLPGLGNAVFGSLLAWLVLAKRTRKVTRRLKIKSMPQFFDQRFVSRPMKLFSAAVIFLFLLPYSASVYKGLTSVCAVLLGVDEQVCMIVIALASAAVVVLGGYIATLKADFVQGIVMLVGVLALIVAVVRCQQVGGLSAGLQAISRVTEDLQLGVADHIALWATVLMTSFGTWGLPQMIHKYYGIRDDREVKRGTVISTLFALVIAGGGYFIGSLSRLFYQELPSPPGGGAGSYDYLVPNMLNGVAYRAHRAGAGAAHCSVRVHPGLHHHYRFLHPDHGSAQGTAVSQAGPGGDRPGYQRPVRPVCAALLCNRQFPDTHSGYDVVFVGNLVRLLSGPLCPVAVLEGDQPHWRLGRDGSGLCHGSAASGCQASFPRSIPALLWETGGFGPAFRLPGYDRILPVLLGVQPHRPGRPAERRAG